MIEITKNNRGSSDRVMQGREDVTLVVNNF